MNSRSILRRWIPPVLADLIDTVRSPPETRAMARYTAGGRIPWSDGYGEYREQAISATLDNPDLMNRLIHGGSLPVGFGSGLDERCVEYPWVLSQLSGCEGRVLDAGSSLNHRFFLARPELQRLRLHIVTLSPEARCFWRQGHGYLYEDLRQLPIADATYETVVCVSTLEHVGFDNQAYTGELQEKPNETVYLQVMAELRRVLRPGGSLLLTVPFGRLMHLGSFCQFDIDRLDAAVAAFGPIRTEDRLYFRYTDTGWTPSDAAACADSDYVDWICRLPSERTPEFPIQPDNAAAARAVALVRLERM